MTDGLEEYDLLDYARAGEIEPFKALFAKPSGIEEFRAARDEFTKATPLHMAAANGHFELLKYIIDQLPSPEVLKEAVNAVNDSGNTPMHWAALLGSLESVRLLFEAGADPLHKNSMGYDVLYQAETAGQDEVMNYLCSVVDLDSEGETEEQEK